jgi:hypothetical protein
MLQTTAKPDWGFRCIAAMVSIVALWLLAMPFCQFIQQTTFNRYHLQSGSFAAWATQAPIPAMYNFHNRYRIEPQPWDATLFSRPETGTINHFPVRLYTFGDNRAIMLPRADQRMLTVESRYRGRTLTTRWTATPASDGGYELSDEVIP